MAITACAAKFSSSAISFSENGRTSWRAATICPKYYTVFAQRHEQRGMDARVCGGDSRYRVIDLAQIRDVGKPSTLEELAG